MKILILPKLHDSEAFCDWFYKAYNVWDFFRCKSESTVSFLSPPKYLFIHSVVQSRYRPHFIERETEKDKGLGGDWEVGMHECILTVTITAIEILLLLIIV